MFHCSRHPYFQTVGFLLSTGAKVVRCTVCGYTKNAATWEYLNGHQVVLMDSAPEGTVHQLPAQNEPPAYIQGI